MTDKKIWFITGGGRGMGVDIAKAALAAGNAVVATGRDTDAVAKAVGEADDLLVVKLDITSRADAEAAVQAAVDRFGRIDVLVNNAGNFHAGYFEELTPEQIERQLATTLIGPMNVTRAVLPVMRKQRSGHVVTISSTAGLAGFEFCTAYAASKFGLEGWMESLAARGRAVRHPHHDRQPGVLSHGAAHEGVDELRRALHRRLRRAQRQPSLRGGRRRTASQQRRPGQARAGAAHHRRRGAAAAPLHRRRRLDRHCRAEGRRSPGADRRPPRPLDVARSRRARAR